MENLPYPTDVLLGASLNLVYASMTSLILPSNEEHLHLGLAVLHETQIRMYSQISSNNTEIEERYQSLRAVHLSFEQMHRGIDQRSQAISNPVIQRSINRDC